MATPPLKRDTAGGTFDAHPDSSDGARGLDDLEARVRELKHDLVERDRDLFKLRRLIASHEATLQAWQTEIASLQSHIAFWKSAFNAVVRSRSWKLSAPVRFLGRAWRNATRGTTPSEGQPDRQEMLVHVNNQPEQFEFELHHDSVEPTPSDPQTAASFQLLDRLQLLETTLREMIAGVGSHTEGGRYIHRVSDRIDSRHLDVKAIAFYTPQYCGNERIDGVKAASFADWADVSTALPRYAGHYQPHVPDHPGSYDQRLPEVLQNQINLATQYGIFGFCFQLPVCEDTHQFADPLKVLTENPAFEIGFCVCWGRTDDDRPASTGMFPPWERLGRLFADPRYIRIDGKPLLVVSGSSGSGVNVQALRAGAAAMRLPELYLAGHIPQASLISNFDAAIQRPETDRYVDITGDLTLIDQNFRGNIHSYSEMMERCSLEAPSNVLTFRNVLTGYDNEPVRPGQGTSFAGASAAVYANWLNRSCRMTMKNRPEERFVFISSWNEWAEGKHLEPDRRFGYAYLHATANVLRSYHRNEEVEKLIDEANSHFSRTGDVAIVLHCHYEDLIGPIFDRYLSKANGADLIVTVRYDVSRRAILEMRKRFPNVLFLRHENRGRDIRPFILALRRLRALGYAFGCKVHTKKTPQAACGVGDLWREKLIERLLGAADSCAEVVRLFNDDPTLGLLVPEGSLMDLREPRNHIDNTYWLDRLVALGKATDLSKHDVELLFPAGSMYWFRTEALAGLDDLVFPEDAFEMELGQRDGTLAHAIERIVSLFVLGRGYQMREINIAREDGPSSSALSGKRSAQTLAPSS